MKAHTGFRVGLALLVAVLVSPRAAVADVPWETDLARATAAAKQSNRPMLLEFWAQWCAPCKVMDDRVFSDPRVASAMESVLPVRIDMDRQQGVARKYGVEATPTLLLTDSHGNELFRHTGLIMADTLLPLLAALPRDVTRINQLASAIDDNKDDLASLDALGAELRAAALYRASNQYYDRALRTRAARQDAAARARILLSMGHNHAQLKSAKEAARVFERFIREFSGHVAEPEALLGLSEALIAQDKPAEARQRLEMLVTRHDGTPAAAAAARLMRQLDR